MQVRWKSAEVIDESHNKKTVYMNGGKPTIQIAVVVGKKVDGRPERNYIRFGSDAEKGEVYEATIPDTDVDNCREIRNQIYGYVEDGVKIAGKWKDLLEIVEVPKK